MDLKDANIIITGAGGALGKALIDLMKDKVNKIIAVDINEDSLEVLKKNDPSLDIHSCDLTDNDKVKNLFSNILDHQNKPNVLINNAGKIANAPLVNLISKSVHSYKDWDNIIRSNLYATFNTTTYFADYLIKNRIKGIIINISSISANGNIGQSAYSAAKAGIEALTKVWGKELGLWGIRTAAIAPGFIDTSSTKEALSDEQLNTWKKNVPLRRLGEVNDLDKAICFIIENNYFNGKILQLDGGLTI